MREDLIERLRGSLYACNAIRGYLDEAGFPADGNAHGQLSEVEATLTEAAAALEAAREDGARLDWFADQMRITDLHSILDSVPLEPCELRAAIDQARGKGVADEA